MNVERWLQMHLVALCLLGSLFVALSTENYLVPCGVLLAGITSVYFTDALRWFRLNRIVGNLAAVGAVLFSLSDFWNGGVSEDQLLAIASLLVYLQVILFYQEKHSRLYWQMILLSLLQVVVGAALHLGLAFGVLLLFYTVVSISALVLFFIHRETEQHTSAHGDAPPEILPAEGSAKTWSVLLGRPAEVRIDRSREEISRSFLTRELAFQIGLFTLGSMLFAMAFFYSAPRHSNASWSGARGFARPRTGFTREVELQQMGEMLQSNLGVLKVTLEDQNDRPLQRLEPYLAGEVLVDYKFDNAGHARWIAATLPERIGRSPQPPPAEHTRVTFSMKGTRDPALFAITPAYAREHRTPGEVQIDALTQLLFYKTEDKGGHGVPDDYTYSVTTTGIQQGKQSSIVPDKRLDDSILKQHLRECGHWPSEYDERFPRLKAIAAEIVESHNLSSSSDPILIARALEDHFQTPGLYTYTLNFNFERNHELDPIEDFVANHRRGHCQYFASALVMMLRSQKIPARMVVGYKGMEYNEVGRHYQVRQRNAHAWVEMHLTQKQVPEYEVVGDEVGDAGAWMRLDPTPADEAAGGALARNWLGTARDWLDYVDTMWSNYVVGLNGQRQQQALYGQFADEEAAIEDAEAWRERMRTIASWFGIHIERGKQWKVAADWRAGLTAMVLCVLVIALARLARWAAPRIDWSALAFWQRHGKRSSVVPFYARLERLLERRGRSRRPAETPHEYVDHAIRELSIDQGDALRRTVDAFYRVRFGGATLDTAEIEAIEHALADLSRPVVE